MRGKARDVIKVLSTDQNDEFNTETDNYSKQIVELQKKNLELYSENQSLSIRYDQLTFLNQELGNDIACFDKDIGILENNIQDKFKKYEKCCQEAAYLCQILKKKRKGNSSDIKTLEIRRKKLVQSLHSLIQHKEEVEQLDSLKFRANKTQQNQLIDVENKELLDQISLLKFLMNNDFSAEEKQKILNTKLKHKESERDFIEKQINFLKNSQNDNNPIYSSEKSEFADDEETYSSNSIQPPQITEKENETQLKPKKLTMHSETIPKSNNFQPKNFNSDVIRRKNYPYPIKKSNTDDVDSLASSSSFLFESMGCLHQINNTKKIEIGLQLDENELDTTIVHRTSTLEINNKAILANLKKILKERIEQKKLIESRLNRLSIQFKVSNLTIYADPLKHISHTKIRTTVSNQTDLTNDMIEFYSNLMNGKLNSGDIFVSDSVPDLQMKIQEKANHISVLKVECQKRDEAIKRVQDEIDQQQKSSNADNSGDEFEYRMKLKMSSDINSLKNEASTQRALYHSTVEENEKLNDQLNALQLKRIEMEREVDTIASKQKPEFEELTEKVEDLVKVGEETKQKFNQAKNELDIKRKEMDSIKSSDEFSKFRDLFLRKNKLERRILKWKNILKEAAENAQYLRDFTQINIGKRIQLKALVTQLENEMFDKEEELNVTEKYETLLKSMLNELKHNWI